MKRCNKCKKVLPEDQFLVRASGLSLRSSCKKCDSHARARDTARIDFANTAMPIVFELLKQHGPMQSCSIIALLKQQDIQASSQRLLYSLPLWERAQSIEINTQNKTGFVYRIVGDTRPLFILPAKRPAKPAPKPWPEKRPVVDAAEMDAWFESLKAEVAQRQAQREAMRHG